MRVIAAVIATGLAALICVLYVAARLGGWGGTVGAISYPAGSTILIGQSGAQVKVPSWALAKRPIRLPGWLGLEPDLAPSKFLLVEPLRGDTPQLSVGWGTASPSWSDISPAESLEHVEPGPDLGSFGVTSIALTPSRVASNAADVHLFVNNPAGRYLVTLTTTQQSGIDATLIARELKSAGFSFE